MIASKEKERCKDLELSADYCESIATDMMSIVSSLYKPEPLLHSIDDNNTEFLDYLIENEQKVCFTYILIKIHFPSLLVQLWVLCAMQSSSAD